MGQAFLSDVELYYSSHSIYDESILLDGEEAHHITNVMRHKIGDEIYITNGTGSIFKSVVAEIGKRNILAKVIDTYLYKNRFENIWFCISRLKSADRFEFALEKCVELGITNFIIYDSKRTVAKGEKTDRWNKILLAAMKQSLRAWLPKIQYEKSLDEITKLEGKKIIFDQNAEKNFISILNPKFLIGNYFLIFGPEGGLTEEEMNIPAGVLRKKLTDNRLRSETAIVTAASLLTTTIAQ